MAELPWARACADFETALRRRTGLDTVVAPLGVRDELSGQLPTSGRPTPLHFTGRHVIAGPFGGRARVQASARYLARRWQRIRDPLVRDALETGGPTHAVGTPPQLTDFAVDATAALLQQLQQLLAETANTDGSNTGGTNGELSASEDGESAVYQLDLAQTGTLRTRVLADPDCRECSAPYCGTPDRFDLLANALVNPVCGVLGQATVAELDLPTTSSALGVIAERAGGRLYELPNPAPHPFV